MAHALRTTHVCPEHPNAHLVECYSDGDVVCSECGLVVAEGIIDYRPRILHDDDTGETANVGAGGGSVNAEGVLSALNLSGFALGSGAPGIKQRSTMSSRDKTRAAVFGEIGRVCALLGVKQSTEEVARNVHDKVLTHAHLQHSKRATLALVCVFMACSECGVSRSIKEVCGTGLVAPKRVLRLCGKVKQALGSRDKPGDPRPAATAVYKSSELVARALGYLNRSRLRGLAMTAAARAERSGLVTGRNPSSITAAVVVLTCEHAGEAVRITDVRSATGTCESTIRTVVRILDSIKDTLFAVSSPADLHV